MIEKTCGTCGNVRHVTLECSYAQDDWEKGGYRYYAGFTTPNARACEHWIEGSESIYQRFEKLEKIAVSLLDKIEDEILGKAEISVHEVQTLRGEVWALGVSVDD